VLAQEHDSFATTHLHAIARRPTSCAFAARRTTFGLRMLQTQLILGGQACVSPWQLLHQA
jgi:hypothetical protein